MISVKNENKAVKRLTVLLACSLGFFSANAQIVILREVLNFGRGNELAVASAFFFWLAGIGTGAWVFAFARPGNRGLALYILGWVSIICSFCAAALCRVFGALVLEPGVAVSITDLLLCCAVGLFLPGLAVGALFPVILRSGFRTVNGSLLYLLEAAGSAAAGFLFTFLLAGRVGHFAILAGAAIPMVAAQTLFFTAGRSRSGSVAAWAAAACFSAASLAGSGALDSAAHAMRFKSITGGLELLRTVETKYQRLDLALAEDEYSIFSDSTFDFTFPDPYGAGRLADTVLLQHPSPKRMLVIGGSPVDIAERSKAHGLEKTDYVQLDPAVMDLVRQGQGDLVERYFCPGCVGAFRPMDGRRFVRLAKKRGYDIIWAELADPLTLLVNRYYTVEFYRQVEQVLRPGGMFVTGFSLDYTSPQESSKRYSAGILKTIGAVFEKTLLGLHSRVLVFASDASGGQTGDPDELSRRAAARGLDPLLYPPEMFENMFVEQRSRWLRGQLEKQEAVINRDMHPVSYRLQLQTFVHLTGADIRKGEKGLQESILEKTWQVPWWLALLPALAAAGLLMARRRKEAASSSVPLVYAMALTGASGILLQIVLLFAYQTFSGIMYEGLGLLYGAFMFGLVAGTAAGRKFEDKSALIAELAVMANTGAVLLLLPAASQAVALIPVFVFTTGFAVGFSFPLLYAAHRRLRESMKKEGFVQSAGIIDGADHVGAAVGAFVCALVLIPSFGLESTLALVLAYKLSSFFPLLSFSRKKSL
ncbi:MAG: hypothetical protein ABIJ56_11865 [Pseudomonadota bacterium]